MDSRARFSWATEWAGRSLLLNKRGTLSGASRFGTATAVDLVVHPTPATQPIHSSDFGLALHLHGHIPGYLVRGALDSPLGVGAKHCRKTGACDGGEDGGEGYH